MITVMEANADIDAGVSLADGTAVALLDLLKHLSRLSKAPKFRGRQRPHWRH